MTSSSDRNQSIRLCREDHTLYAYRAQVKIEMRDYSGAHDDLCDAMEEDYSKILLMSQDDACAQRFCSVM